MRLGRWRQLVEQNPDDWTLNVAANIVADLILIGAVVLVIYLARGKAPLAEAIVEAS